MKIKFLKMEFCRLCEISDGVEKIEEGAFLSCNELAAITLPNSVKEIAETAFDLCRLEAIVYGGTVEEWKAIDKGDAWSDFGDNEAISVTICCTDGQYINTTAENEKKRGASPLHS